MVLKFKKLSFLTWLNTHLLRPSSLITTELCVEDRALASALVVAMAVFMAPTVIEAIIMVILVNDYFVTEDSMILAYKASPFSILYLLFNSLKIHSVLNTLNPDSPLLKKR